MRCTVVSFIGQKYKNKNLKFAILFIRTYSQKNNKRNGEFGFPLSPWYAVRIAGKECRKRNVHICSEGISKVRSDKKQVKTNIDLADTLIPSLFIYFIYMGGTRPCDSSKIIFGNHSVDQ